MVQRKDIDIVGGAGVSPASLHLSLPLQDSESCSDPIDHELLRAADGQAQRSAYLLQGRDSQRFQLCGKRRREVSVME